MRRRRPGRGDDRRAAVATLGDAGIRVRLQPGAKRNEIAGERDGALLVRVTAPPVEGRANEALCRLVAKRLGVARGRVSIVRGERSREKVIRIAGIEAAVARRILAG